MKVALILGVNGQDGSYLAELLLQKGYKFYEIIRRLSFFMNERIDHIEENASLTKSDSSLEPEIPLFELVIEMLDNDIKKERLNGI